MWRNEKRWASKALIQPTLLLDMGVELGLALSEEYKLRVNQNTVLIRRSSR
jgi:hypothetical protein